MIEILIIALGVALAWVGGVICGYEWGQVDEYNRYPYNPEEYNP